MTRTPKKHWIMVKRGLSADPKHREAMGQAVWCFLHIIDRTDFETGKVYDWRDADEAEDMGVNERTLRSWRQNLEKAGYISCKQKQRGLEITVWNWINPRDYSAGLINPKGDKNTAPSPESQGDMETAPLGDTNMSPSAIQGDMQGDIRGDIRVPEKNVTPTSPSRIINQGSRQPGDENLAWLSQKYTQTIGAIPNVMIADELKDLSALPREWLEYGFAQLIEARSKAPVRQAWGYVKACVKTCQEHGAVPTRADKPKPAGKAAAALALLRSS